MPIALYASLCKKKLEKGLVTLGNIPVHAESVVLIWNHICPLPVTGYIVISSGYRGTSVRGASMFFNL